MVDLPLDRREEDRPPEPDRPAEQPSAVLELLRGEERPVEAPDPAGRRLARPARDVPDEVASVAAPPEIARPAADRGDRVRELDLGAVVPEREDHWADRPMPPGRYAEALRQDPEVPRPAFDGEPRREQVEQGRLGDCGVIAALGAAAAHRPEAIRRSVTDAGDGGYEVELHHPEWDGETCRASGDTVRMQVPSEVPVFDHRPDRPAFAQAPEAAWPAVLEKALAGYDAAWSPEQRARWEESWELTRKVRDADRRAIGLDPLPEGMPTGYARLNQGSTAWDRAEVLTQVTGEASAVREFPPSDEALATVLESRLDEGKPVLAGTRPLNEAAGEEDLPHRLEASHAYEVTAVKDGRVELHNPWNTQHPEPLAVAEFREFFSWPDRQGRRHGKYTTLE